MLELIVVALFQAAAGEPNAAPPAPAADAPVSSGAAESAPAASEASPAPTDEAAPAAPTADAPMVRQRVCEYIEVTGRRMPQRVCRNIMVPADQVAAAEQD